MNTNYNDMDKIRVGIELHRSAVNAVIHAIEDLLENHPLHSQSAKRDFKHAYSMILFSMIRWLQGQLHQVDKTTFEHGKLCVVIEKEDAEPDGDPQ